MVNKWKTTAIVFMTLFLLLLAFNVWSVSLVFEDEALTNECYYDICEQYPNAWQEDAVCYCYDYNEYGEEEVVKTKYMK